MSSVTGRLRAKLVSGRLRRNATFSVAQSAAVTISFFLVYRILIEQVGVARVGIWSLMLAATALMKIGDFSGTGALSRFVAATTGQGYAERARDYVHTVILTSLAMNIILGLIVYLIGPAALKSFVEPQYREEAGILLPFVIITMIVGTLAVGVCSAIDGAQRADQRAVVVSFGALVFLLASWLLVPKYGVMGYGAAHVLQQAVLFGAGWVVLKRSIQDLGWIPRRWRRSVFVETTGFAVKLQGIAVTNMLFEPIAKFSFNLAGGPTLVVYYELASRLIAQVRALVIAAATPLVPAFAVCSSIHQREFKDLLDSSTRALIPAAMLTSVGALIAAPIISLFVLGTFETDVLRMNAGLAFGWGVNVLCVSFYFAGQARGILRWNLSSHAVIAMAVLVGARMQGSTFGAHAVIASIVVGLILAAAIVLIGNAKALDATEVLGRQKVGLLAASLVIGSGCGLMWVLYS